MSSVSLHRRLQHDSADPHLFDKEEEVPHEHLHRKSGNSRFDGRIFLRIADIIDKQIEEWQGGVVMCKVTRFIQGIAIYGSNYALVALSIDRLDSIARPLKSMSKALLYTGSHGRLYNPRHLNRHLLHHHCGNNLEAVLL